MSAENVETVRRIQAALPMGEVTGAFTDTAAERTEANLADLVERDFECDLVAPAEYGGGISGRGLEGFKTAWADWTDAFSDFRIEVREVIDAGDQVVTLVRQGGRTRTGGVEMMSDAAAVWTLRNGRLHRVAFHLDQAAALRAAGLDPDETLEQHPRRG